MTAAGRWGAKQTKCNGGLVLARPIWVRPGDVHFSQDHCPRTLYPIPPYGVNGPFRPIHAIQGVGYRVGEGVTVVLGEMYVARVNPYRSGQGEPPLHLRLFRTPPTSGGHPIPGGGGDSRSP